MTLSFTFPNGVIYLNYTFVLCFWCAWQWLTGKSYICEGCNIAFGSIFLTHHLHTNDDGFTFPLQTYCFSQYSNYSIWIFGAVGLHCIGVSYGKVVLPCTKTVATNWSNQNVSSATTLFWTFYFPGSNGNRRWQSSVRIQIKMQCN